LASSETSPPAEGQHSPAVEASEPKGKIDVFSGYFAESLWTLVAFFLTLVVLWKLAWKPLLARLQDREGYIAKQISDAERIRKDAEGVLAEYRSKLVAAEKEGDSIVARHIKQAEEHAHEVTVKAQKELELMRVRMETDIERTRREAERELLEESGKIIVNLGKEILGKALTGDDNQRMIDQAIERFKAENRDEKTA
jgi:F-type H+-transporting ATPase subunit b